MYTVYRIYCKTNKKSYIGITDSFKRRMAVHWNTFTNTVLSRTIRKYGKENFKVYTIDSAKTWQEACEKEQKYIASLNTKVPNGMNMTDGGEGVFGLKHSDRTRKKMAESHKGKNLGPDNPMYGKPGAMLGRKWTDEQKKKLSESCKGKTPWNKGKKGLQEAWNKGIKGIPSPKKGMPGKKWTEETRERMKIARKGCMLGSKHWATNFIESDILEIRRIYAAREMNQYELAEKFNVTQPNIYCIINRKSWKHI